MNINQTILRIVSHIQEHTSWPQTTLLSSKTIVHDSSCKRPLDTIAHTARLQRLQLHQQLQLQQQLLPPPLDATVATATAATKCCLHLLIAARCCWMLLAASYCSLLLAACAGCCSPLLDAAGYCYLRLTRAGFCYWMLLQDAAGFCWPRPVTSRPAT